MPIPASKIPPAPQPTRVFFDPFNSSSTGHQRAENRLSGHPSWRDSRQYKLAAQFGDVSGRGGTKHIADLVGAGSENYGKDGRESNGCWEVGAPGLREAGWQDIRGLMSVTKKKRKSDEAEHVDEQANKKARVSVEQILSDAALSAPTNAPAGMPCSKLSDASYGSNSKTQPQVDAPATDGTVDSTLTAASETLPEQAKRPPQIFRGLTLYLNGSTAPLISDHKLKQRWVLHGGNCSIALGRRTVTHVILGKTCGGGLASSKINREVTTVGGKGIKYVTVQWVLDCIEKGVRQSEGRYMPDHVGTRIGGSGQKSVAHMFSKKT